MSNIVTAVFEAGARGTVTSPLFQWDYGQVLQFQGLELPDTYEVHFANTDTRTSVTMLGNADGVDIPDACLTSGEPIYAWVFLHTGEDDGETEYTVSIPVIARAEPSDIEPTPVQQDVITQAIAALNSGVTRAETAAESAETSAEEADEAAAAAHVEYTDLSDKLDEITEDVSAVYITPGLSVTSQGVTFTYDADRNAIKAYGIAAAPRRLLCLNGQNAIALTWTDFNATFEEGIYKFATAITGNLNAISWQYTYDTFANPTTLVSSADGTVEVAFADHAAMVGLLMDKNADFGTEDNPTYITLTVTRLSAIDYAARNAAAAAQAESAAQIARVDGEIAQINDVLNHEPMHNYLGGVVNSPSTKYGLTCSQLDDGTYTITGTATSSRTTLFYDIYYDRIALPDGMEAGKTYHLFADSTQFGARIITYTSESDNGTVLVDGATDGFVSTDFTIPADATGISFRWQARGIVESVSYNYTDMRLMVTPTTDFVSKLIESYSGSTDENANAHIWCIGNSFLNGAVYTNGHLDHMAPYDDAIYGQIAYALNILPANNTHVMYSSTGLITPPSGGANSSFLDIITQTSLAPYDFLVTHFNGGDINGHALGTINSTANDGTIAGGVIALMNYIRTNNGLCKLILLSVPPYSSDPAKSGEYVFTGNWGQGYSINDLDNLMYQLAKKLHFIFVSWQDLEISYHYMDYADYDPSQTNVRHAASNAVYRALGQYAGLQLSAVSSPIALSKMV